MIKKIWNETPNIYVAFLDIMGFKDRVFRERHKDVKKMLESLHEAKETILKDAKKSVMKLTSFQENHKNIKKNPPVDYLVSFSDSIILFSSDDTKDSLNSIIVDVEYIFSEALDNEIPLKGAIAFGEMTVNINKSLYFGRPLIDAYELHKDLQMYGVVLHHTAQKRFDEELSKDPIWVELVVSDYPVPMKSGKINHHLLDWTIFVPREENPENIVKQLYNNVSGTTRIYVDNTLEFVRWNTARKQELNHKEKS